MGASEGLKLNEKKKLSRSRQTLFKVIAMHKTCPKKWPINTGQNGQKWAKWLKLTKRAKSIGKNSHITI